MDDLKEQKRQESYLQTTTDFVDVSNQGWGVTTAIMCMQIKYKKKIFKTWTR